MDDGGGVAISWEALSLIRDLGKTASKVLQSWDLRVMIEATVLHLIVWNLDHPGPNSGM